MSAANESLGVSADLPGAATRGGELRENWPALVGCTLGLAVGVHSLPFYTSGLFMGSLTGSFGWTRTQMSLATTILIAGIALLSPFMGAIVDRYGERKVASPSLVLVALGFVALAFMDGSLTAFYVTFAAMAVLGAGSATPTFCRIIARTFDKARGTALGIGLVGTGLASTLSPLLLTPIIAGDGWKAGYLALAAAVAVSVPVIALLTRRVAVVDRTPGIVAPPVAGVELREALRDPVFWTLVAIFALVALATPGLVVHFVPMLLDDGLTAQRAAVFASTIGISLILARLAAGFLIDVFFAPRVGAALMALSAAALAMLALGGAPYALCGAIAIGLSFGAEFDLVAYLCARYFGFRAYGRLYGLFYAVVLGGTAVSPLLYGTLRDSLGSYTTVLLISAGTLLVAAVLFLTLPRFDLAVSRSQA